jgi:hypothetical protein
MHRALALRAATPDINAKQKFVFAEDCEDGADFKTFHPLKVQQADLMIGSSSWRETDRFPL